MKVTEMPAVHAANLVANSGNTTHGVDVMMFSKIMDDAQFREMGL